MPSLGVPGAPRTGVLSADFKTLKGLGFNITAITDAVGPMRHWPACYQQCLPPSGKR